MDPAAGLAVAPSKVSDFSPSWGDGILRKWLQGQEGRSPEGLHVSRVEAKLNGQQGLLSTTFLVDIFFRTKETENEEEEEKKSVFVKIPLTGEAGKNFKQVNVREFEMFSHILPELQSHLDTNCDGFFRLAIPELLYCHYQGDEVHDVLVIENLVETGFVTCQTEDLQRGRGGQDYLKSTLETLAQLHGTGLHYKRDQGGRQGVLERFPKIEEQIQIQDILKNKESRIFIRQYFCSFIRYLEETDSELLNITTYMKKLDTYLFKILTVLDESGVGNLNTLCHGDAKPNNFMFRKIALDFEDDEEFKDLSCEGVESMLIDWQGGFLGSLCNDLMWCIFPFLEVNGHDPELYEFSLSHYYSELKNVLETFNCSLTTFGLPESLAEFRSLVRRGFVLEFLIVTTLRPVLNITRPEEMEKWWKQLQRYEAAQAATGVKGWFRKLLVNKRPELPSQDDVFQNPRYMEFLQFYFKIGTSLGAFQELGLIYFELMKDSMFGESKIKGYEDDLKPKVKVKLFSKEWLRNLQPACLKGVPEETEKERIVTGDQVGLADMSKIDEAKPGVQTDNDDYEPILMGNSTEEVKDMAQEVIKDVEEAAEMKDEVTVEVIVEPPREKSPSPPDPLRTLAAELHEKFGRYRESYGKFNTGMNEMHEEIVEEMKKDAEEQENESLTKEDEQAAVRKMSQENAWAHVASTVIKERGELSRQNSKEEVESWKEEEQRNQEAMEKMQNEMADMEEQMKNVVCTVSLENNAGDIITDNTKCVKNEIEEPLPLESVKVVADAEVYLQGIRNSLVLETNLSPPVTKDDFVPESPSELKETLKKITYDIDLSNDKVLETIAFLTTTDDDQLKSEDLNTAEKKEQERRDLEMLLDEDESKCLEPEKKEQANTRDKIIAWLGTKTESAEDSDFVYVSPWADEDNQHEAEKSQPAEEMDSVSAIAEVISHYMATSSDFSTKEKLTELETFKHCVQNSESQNPEVGTNLEAEEEVMPRTETEVKPKYEGEAELRVEFVSNPTKDKPTTLNAELESNSNVKSFKSSAEEEAELNAEAEARLKAEEESMLKAKECARVEAEEEAMLIIKNSMLKAENAFKLQAEEAKLKGDEEKELTIINDEGNDNEAVLLKSMHEMKAAEQAQEEVEVARKKLKAEREANLAKFVAVERLSNVIKKKQNAEGSKSNEAAKEVTPKAEKAKEDAEGARKKAESDADNAKEIAINERNRLIAEKDIAQKEKDEQQVLLDKMKEKKRQLIGLRDKLDFEQAVEEKKLENELEELNSKAVNYTLSEIPKEGPRSEIPFEDEDDKREADDDDEEDEDEVMLIKMMEELKAAEEAQATAESVRKKAERDAEIAKEMAVNERNRLRAEKDAAEKEGVEQKGILDTMQDKKRQLIELREKLKMEQEMMAQARQELETGNEEMYKLKIEESEIKEIKGKAIEDIRIKAEEEENLKKKREEAQREVAQLNSETDAILRGGIESDKFETMLKEEKETQNRGDGSDRLEEESDRLEEESEVETQRVTITTELENLVPAIEADYKSNERTEAETIKDERVKAEKEEGERELEARKAKLEQVAAEKAELLKALETAKAQAQKIAGERAEAERVFEIEKKEAERVVAEFAEAEREEAAFRQEEAEMVAADIIEAERQAIEEARNVETERMKAEMAESIKLASEIAEADKLIAEKAEAEKVTAEKEEGERLVAEMVEADNVAAKKAEAERKASEKAEAEREALEKWVIDKMAVEKAKAEALEKSEAENVAIAKEAPEKAAYANIEAEKMAAEQVASENLDFEIAEEAAADNLELESKEAEESLEADETEGYFFVNVIKSEEESTKVVSEETKNMEGKFRAGEEAKERVLSKMRAKTETPERSKNNTLKKMKKKRADKVLQSQASVDSQNSNDNDEFPVKSRLGLGEDVVSSLDMKNSSEVQLKASSNGHHNGDEDKEMNGSEEMLSKNNTLKRNWKRSSKKKRKSVHVL